MSSQNSAADSVSLCLDFLQYIGQDVTTEDSTLSYLPLAHIFDRVVEEFALYSGARIGYYQVSPYYLQPELTCIHCAPALHTCHSRHHRVPC